MFLGRAGFCDKGGGRLEGRKMGLPDTEWGGGGSCVHCCERTIFCKACVCVGAKGGLSLGLRERPTRKPRHASVF